MKKQKQYGLLCLILAALLFLHIYASFPQASNTLSNTDFLRFHVVANSNSERDQALKFKVRDDLVQFIQADAANWICTETSVGEYAPVAASAGTEPAPVLTADLLRRYVQQHLPEIEERARRVLQAEGCADPVNAVLGVRWVPEKTYGSALFPAGLYDALTVTIGEGNGQNWWCVLFPPLCLIGAQAPPDDSVNLNETDRDHNHTTASNLSVSETDAALEQFYYNSIDKEKYRALLEAAAAAPENEPQKLQLQFKLWELWKTHS